MHGLGQLGRPVLEQAIEVFPCMVAARKKQRGFMLADFGDDAGGKNPGARRGALAGGRGLTQTLDPHGGVVAVKALGRGGHLHQRIENDLVLPGALIHQFPLSGSRQGNAQIFLQPGGAIHGNPGAKTPQPQHRADVGIIFIDSGFRRQRRAKNLAARVAAQHFGFKERGRKKRLGGNMHHSRRRLACPQFSRAVRASAPDSQSRVRHPDALSSGVRAGRRSAVSPVFGVRWGAQAIARWQRCHGGLGQHRCGLLGFSAEKPPLQPPDARGLFFQRLQDPLKSAQQVFQQLIGGRGQFLAQLRQQRFQLDGAQLDDYGSRRFSHGRERRAVAESRFATDRPTEL